MEKQENDFNLKLQEGLSVSDNIVASLKTDRSFGKYVIFSILTFGIYGLVVMNDMVNEINTVCGKYDGKKSLNYIVVVLLSGITLGIVPFVWFINVSNRMGNELKRRHIDYSFDAKTFLLWGVLGTLLIVGPFVYFFKFIEANRLLNQSYNQIG